jgi:hypothetical protein
LAPLGNYRRQTAVTDQTISAIITAADRFPGNCDLCRFLCEVGRWAADRGDSTAATRALTAAQLVRDRLGGGEQDLWVADLAARLGRMDLASDIQVQMLQQQRLPLGRIKALITAVRQRGDETSAEQLEAQAAKYARLSITPTTKSTSQPSAHPSDKDLVPKSKGT